LARFRKKLFKKQDPDFKTEEIKTFERKQPESVIVEESNSIDKPLSIKSLIKSGTKYAYLIAVTAFLAGIFTPFTLDMELNNVILGMLVIFLGLGGGVLIFKATTRKKYSFILILIGLALMITSLILILQNGLLKIW
tara:strand:+ start:838 stop:1248 length:411 start_codon:yes stop_codon:yes gene_type:complete